MGMSEISNMFLAYILTNEDSVCLRILLFVRRLRGLVTANAEFKALPAYSKNSG